MNTGSPTPALKRRRDLVLIVLFVVFIWLPTLDSLLHFDRLPAPGENRLPAAFPQFSHGIDGQYLAGLESYFNDHFGCRKLLVRFYRQWRMNLFGDKAGWRSVITGRDGWYYFGEGQMVEHFRGTLKFTPEELRDWQVYLERHRDWLTKRGIKFVFVISPDKQSVYPEYLPAWLTRVSPETKLDQFFDYMKARSNVEVLDLRPVLREARRSGPVYLKTDTHWNQFGAFVAYQQLMETLARQLPGLQPLSLNDFDRVSRSAPAGDLAPFAGIAHPESNAVFFTPKPALPPIKTTAKSSVQNSVMVVTEIKNAAAKGSAVLYHDSFGNFWVPFIGYQFGHVTCRTNDHLETNFFDPAVLEKEKPDVVIIQLLERYFNVAKPGELMAGERLP